MSIWDWLKPPLSVPCPDSEETYRKSLANLWSQPLALFARVGESVREALATPDPALALPPLEAIVKAWRQRLDVFHHWSAAGQPALGDLCQALESKLDWLESHLVEPVRCALTARMTATPPQPAQAAKPKFLDGGEPGWTEAAAGLLLAPPATIHFPVVGVLPTPHSAGYQGVIHEAVVQILQFSQAPGTLIPHPCLPRLGGSSFRLSLEPAWFSAWHLALEFPDTPNKPQGCSAAFHFLDLHHPQGGSAGGAFALALHRGLAGQTYDRRLAVIASVDPRGRLGPVEGGEMLQAKIQAVIDHPGFNDALPQTTADPFLPTPSSRFRIDTIAIASQQRDEIAGILRELDPRGRIQVIWE